MTMRAPSAALLVILVSLLLSGCASVSYYGQAISGHVEVMLAARSIDDWLGDPQALLGPAGERVRIKLERAQWLREFASATLQLPDNASYTSYADLKRRFVVWNIVAAPEFELRPKEFCFVVVGCLAYRGFYALADATAAASALKAAGYDVTLGGVRAYSTLGWFDDPLLNTMLEPAPPYLAQVMFHELAHQVLYIADDSRFNEAFATAVQQLGVARWLRDHGDARAHALMRQRQAEHVQFIRLLVEHRGNLQALYRSKLADSYKRQRKAELLDALRFAYQQLAADWDNPNAYATFFAAGLNNARLASVATYFELVPAFVELARQLNYGMPEFYAAAGALAVLSRAQRETRLAELTQASTRRINTGAGR